MSKFIFKMRKYKHNCVDIVFDEYNSGILIQLESSQKIGFVNTDEDKIRYKEFCKRLNIQFV